MKAQKNRSQRKLSLAVTGLICAFPLWGCDPDQRAALAEQIGDSVRDQIDAEKEALLEELKEELSDSINDAGTDVEDALAETVAQNEVESEDEDDERDALEGEHEPPPLGVTGLDSIDVLHPELGGIFGPVELAAQEARLFGEHEDALTQLEIWSDDYRQMVMIEITGGLEHPFFQSEGESVFRSLPEGAAPQSDVHVAGASCFGTIPHEVDEDIRAQEITVRKTVDEDSGVVVLEFELSGRNDATGETEVAFASIEMHPTE